MSKESFDPETAVSVNEPEPAGMTAQSEQEEKPRRMSREELLRRLTYGVLSFLLACCCILCLAWSVVHIHPNSGGTPPRERRGRTDVTAALDMMFPDEVRPTESRPGEPEPNATPEPDEDPEPRRVHYVIPDGSLPNPPREACYGRAEISDAASVMDVIAQAREYGLLEEDEQVAFSPDVTFYKYSDIQYYLDETILTICWKEVIDNSVCSLSEVRIADASQFRRKLAGDAYGSSNQYYASELAIASNSVVAMNADFYRFRDLGIVIYNGAVCRFKDVAYSGKYKKYNIIDNLFVNGEGDFLFFDRGAEIDQAGLEQYIKDNDVRFSLAFGPVLVRDGEPQEYPWYTLGEIHGNYSRAGIGQLGKLHYLYMGLNHAPGMKTSWSVAEFARRIWAKGVVNAYCLDGGQTGEIVFRGEPYNHVDYGAERLVSDIIYFASAMPGEVFP